MATGSADVTLIEGSGGAFEIVRDGEIVFSKKALNRFPEEHELDALLS